MKILYCGAIAACLLLPVAARAQRGPQPADAGATVPETTYRATAYTPAAVATETPDQGWLRANIAVAGGGGMGHMMAPAAKPAPGAAVDPHGGHNMPAADPHAGHNMPAADPHAGHDMSAKPAADPHAGHDMSARPAADPHAGHNMQPQQEGI